VNLLGVIGNPVAHSQSPGIFNAFFSQEGLQNWAYQTFELAHISALPDLLNTHPQLRGFNVTIPFKQSIMPYLDETDNAALETGAVNTVKITIFNNKLHLKGYNTDLFGFEKSLTETWGHSFKKAMILGTGGSSLAVQVVLRKLKIPFSLVSRNEGYDFVYTQLGATEIQDHDLIINTTPAGMEHYSTPYPLIPYQFLSNDHFCFDLVYAPKLTGFLTQCAENGAHLKNGQDMLLYQAQKSWEIFKKDLAL
jgi:shikimate dehydrogenase